MFKTAVCVDDCPRYATDTLDCAPNDRMYCNSLEVIRGMYATHDFLDYCMPDMQKL